MGIFAARTRLVGGFDVAYSPSSPRAVNPLPTAILLFGALFSSLSLEPAARGADDADPVATVGDTVLTVSDLERTVRRRSAGRPSGDAAVERARALAELVDEVVLRAEIDRRGIAATDREIDDRMAALSQDLATRKSNLDAFLADQKLDRTSLRQRLALDIAMARLAAALVTPEALERARQNHQREFDGTRVRVAHIVLRPNGADGPRAVAELETRAAAIRRAILEGELTFAEAAARHSAGPSRHRGGDIGFIPRHGQLSEDFARACFALDRGEVSPPIATPFGVHLATVLEADEGSIDPAQFRPQLERLAAQSEIFRLLRECRGATTITVEPGYEIAEEQAPSAAP